MSKWSVCGKRVTIEGDECFYKIETGDCDGDGDWDWVDDHELRLAS